MTVTRGACRVVGLTVLVGLVAGRNATPAGAPGAGTSAAVTD